MFANEFKCDSRRDTTVHRLNFFKNGIFQEKKSLIKL